MRAWLVNIFKASALRGAAMLGRGASVKTPDYEISAPTTQGVIKIMRALRDMPPHQPLRPVSKRNSISEKVQAEEPMIIDG